jgi:hypothetical protein
MKGEYFDLVNQLSTKTKSISLENKKTDNDAEITKLLPDTLSPTEKRGGIRGGEENAIATIITGSLNRASQKDKGRGIILFLKLVKQRENDELLKHAKEDNGTSVGMRQTENFKPMHL